jgi:hypothetical protein
LLLRAFQYTYENTKIYPLMQPQPQCNESKIDLSPHFSITAEYFQPLLFY